MDTRAYIESGIIESYVLGLADAEEAAELEMLCKKYDDIQKALDEFEALMKAHAFDNAITPAAAVKDRIMHALAEDFAKEENENIVPVIPLNVPDEKIKPIARPVWNYIAAASIILLIASTAFNFYLYNNYKSAANKYQALLTERNSLQASNDVYRTNMLIIQDTDVLKINLTTVKEKENNLATVYWNSKTKDVYLMPSKMSPVPSNKQYQLWAIVDGKPVDAGIIEPDCNGLCKMKNIPKAQAFAITVEQKGGSPTPTLTAMVVMGKV